MASGSESIGGGAVFSSPWMSRATAIGVLLVLLLVGYSLLVAPLVAAYSQINGEIAQSNELLARYQRVAAQQSAHKALLDRVSATHTESGVYLPGETDALSAARLQEIVNARVESNGGQVRSVQILPPRDDGDFRRVGVRIQMTANVAAVARMLYAFEAGDMFLFVDNLEISNRQKRQRAGQATDPDLLVRLDLTGYVRPEAEK